MLVVLVTRPLERVIYLLQTNVDATPTDHITLANLLIDASLSTQGLAPSLLLCANPAIHFTIYDRLKFAIEEARGVNTLATDESNISALDAFVVGMISKAIATVVTYPIIRAKVIMMSSKSDSNLSSSAEHVDEAVTRLSFEEEDEEGEEELDEATKQRVALIPWRQIHTLTPESRSDIVDSISSSCPPTKQQSLLGDVQKMMMVLKFIAMIHGVPNLWKGLPLHLVHTVLRDALSMVSVPKSSLSEHVLIKCLFCRVSKKFFVDLFGVVAANSESL